MNKVKKISVNQNRIIEYTISDGYTQIHTISEIFIENGKLIKQYRLSRWDDYGFSGWINTNTDSISNVNSLSYDFEIGHPLYIPLFHLLRDDEQLIIDDDETSEINKKYILISKLKDKINLTFINGLEKTDAINKFYIFIKNIGPDGRSKIDCSYKDTKERLYLFFQEAYTQFNEEVHQITIEEYLLKNSKKFGNEEYKKYVRKWISLNTTYTEKI